MTDIYRREILGIFPEKTDEQLVAEWLWLEYFVDTEIFDRSVCTGQEDGIAVPVMPHERQIINANANLQRRRLRWLARICLAGIGDAELQRAKEDAGRYRHEVAAETLTHVRRRLLNKGFDWSDYKDIARQAVPK